MNAEQAMQLALREARKGEGRAFPNPSVGAVVYRGDRILGRGYTRPAGGPHAEVVALRAARRRAGSRGLRGAAMAVTLEPCCHSGRTGPCTEAILEARLGSVFVGCLDPHPEVSGRGVRKLRRAGVAVELGVLSDACRDRHRAFLSVCERGRPWLTLKLASSLDGRIATSRGESRWITGPAARARVHALRARTDAILVGAETALADDPSLSARRRGRVVHEPVRVLLDSRLRVPTSARLYRRTGRAIVLCARGARGMQAREARGARLLRVRKRGGHLDLDAALVTLAGEGLTHLLVEGGGELAAALLRGGLVDELHWFVAPRLLGGDARPALGTLALRRLSESDCLRDVRSSRVGPDLHVRARVVAPPGRSSPAGRGS